MFTTASIKSRSVYLVMAVTCAIVAALFAASTSASAASGSSKVYFVQGVLGTDVDIKVDGKAVDSSVAPKAVVGPNDLSSGQHTVTFKSSDWTVTKSFNVGHPSMDIALHWPADPADEPVATVFNNKIGPVPAGKGRVMIAHTAVVPPADVRVAGKVLFANIANGEFATTEVPAKTYSVDIVPTGETKPLIGPVDVKIKAGALTRVFAIGNPEQGSMDAVVQVLTVPQGGSANPGSMNMGSAGLVDPRRTEERDASRTVGIGGAALAALVLGAVVGARRRARR